MDIKDKILQITNDVIDLEGALIEIKFALNSLLEDLEEPNAAVITAEDQQELFSKFQSFLESQKPQVTIVPKTTKKATKKPTVKKLPTKKTTTKTPKVPKKSKQPKYDPFAGLEEPLEGAEFFNDNVIPVERKRPAFKTREATCNDCNKTFHVAPALYRECFKCDKCIMGMKR